MATLAVASVLVALVGIGQLVADVPAGAVSERLGERRAMLLASAVAGIGALAAGLAGSIVVLALGVAAIGAAGAIFGVARQAYVTEVVPYARRGRALSTLAGSNRTGLFIGPLLGAVAMSVWGTTGAYVVMIGAAIAVGLVMLRLPDMPSASSGQAAVSTWQVVVAHWPVLRSLGTAVVLLGAVRASRQAIIPLWSAHLGLDPQTASLLVGLSAGVDMVLFYPAGMAMDRLGRRRTAIPSLLILAAAHVVIPLANDALGLAFVALALGAGNGFSSGIMMTLGADASPAIGRSQFLGAWRLCQDLGSAVGPLIGGAVISGISISAAPLTIAGVGLLAAAGMYRWIPRTPPSVPSRASPGE